MVKNLKFQWSSELPDPRNFLGHPVMYTVRHFHSNFDFTISILDQMSSGNNYNVNKGTQGATIVDSRVDNLSINIGQPDHQIDISKTFAKYKNWLCEEKEHIKVRKKLKQLVINGEHCHIKRKLKGNDGEFSEDQLLNEIPKGVTSLVTGPAGSGKSTLAASTMVNWAESEESSFDLVLFLSSLHTVGDLPLHKQLWGEYSGQIKDQDSSKIYDALLERKDNILVIIDGLGKNFFI